MLPFCLLSPISQQLPMNPCEIYLNIHPNGCTPFYHCSNITHRAALKLSFGHWSITMHSQLLNGLPSTKTRNYIVRPGAKFMEDVKPLLTGTDAGLCGPMQGAYMMHG